MNFKKIGLSAAIAAATVAGGIATTAPAQAISLSFSGDGRFSNSGSSAGQLNFFDVSASNSATNGTFGNNGVADVKNYTNGFLANIGDDLSIQDITLVANGANQWKLSSTVNGFISGFKGSRVFNLTTFDLETVGSEITALIEGTFTPSAGAGIAGEFTTQRAFLRAQGTSYSVQFVPTPALIPALVGMGVAAFRKRKQEEESEQVKA